MGRAPYFDQPFYVGFDVGDGIRMASVLEPGSGTFLGLIENPLFHLPDTVPAGPGPGR